MTETMKQAIEAHRALDVDECDWRTGDDPHCDIHDETE